MKVKAFLGVLVFVVLLVVVTYAVFVVWLPSNNPRREHTVTIAATGEEVKVESPGPQNIEKQGDWIVVKGIYSNIAEEYVGDIFIRLEGTFYAL